MELRVKYIAGLGFTPGNYVTIKRSSEQLLFLGVEEKESVAGFTYEVLLGGDEMKRVTPAYNDFIKILTEG